MWILGLKGLIWTLSMAPLVFVLTGFDLVSLTAVLGEHCVTSKKRLRGRLVLTVFVSDYLF